MSIDERLRTGLVQNTELLVPDVEQALVTTYGRARGRQRVRRGALALAAAAAVAVTTWAVDLPGLDDDAVPVQPNPTPRDLVGVRGSLEPGSYSLAVWGETKAKPLPRAILDVPEGYFSNGGYQIDAGSDASPEADQLGRVQVWRVYQVLTDPCRLRTATAVGPTVEDLARALVRHPGPSTKPSPTQLDGHSGLYLEVTIPPNSDLAACADGQYTPWLASRHTAQFYSDRPGVVHHLWILDVDGTRLLVGVSNYPDQPASQHQELIAIAETIHFEPPGS